MPIPAPTRIHRAGRSIANKRAGNSGNIDRKPEQVADLRLLGDILSGQQLSRRSGERSAIIVAAKGDLGNVGDREADSADQLARWRIAPRLPPRVERDPHAAL